MKKTTSQFRDQVVEDAQKRKTQGSQYGYLNLPRGVNIFSEQPDSRVRLDFLRYEVTDEKHPDRNPDTGKAMVGAPWYKRPFRLHRNIGVNNESFVCPTSIGKPCPICNHCGKLRRENSDQEAIRALRASRRNLYVVVPRGAKDYDEKPYIWDISHFCFQDMLDDEMRENPDNGVFPHPEEGLTLRIRFSEESFAKNKFAKAARIDFEQRDKPISEELQKQAPNLDEVLSILSYEELENKFLEIDQEPAGSKVKPADAEDDVTVSGPMRHRPKPKVEDEDEDNNEGSVPLAAQAPRRKPKPPVDEDEDEDDDDTPSPVRHKAKPAVDEDEDEDENEPEVQAPKRKKNGRAIVDDEEDPKSVCVACDGTGENSRGKTCPVCRGTGKRIQAKQQDAEEPAPRKAGGKKDKCPYGYKFGVDCEQYDECDECEIWDACYEAKEAAKSA